MSIKESAQSKQHADFSRAKDQIDALLKYTQKLPKELHEMAKDFQKQFESYDMSQHDEPLKKITGELLSDAALLAMVKEATGYTKWSVSHDFDNDLAETVKWFRERFGIDVNQENIRDVAVERSVNNRSALWLIQFRIVPGHAYVSFDSGRVGIGSEVLIANADLPKYLAHQTADWD